MKKIKLLVFVIHFLSTAINAQSADKIYSKVNNAIVTIYTYDSEDKPVSQGSGVVLNQKGWIVTNYHVYEGSSKMIVKQQNKLIPVLSIIASDKSKDIMILKISDNSFPQVSIGNSNLIKVGEKIYTIGSPLGLENSISEGLVSGLRKNKLENLIQISAPISNGSSGGAVVNSKGDLIGITSSSFTKGQNLNFAIPINEVLKLNSSIIEKKSDKLIENNLYIVEVEKKFGFVNKTGRIIIPLIYEDGRDFNEGVAAVKFGGKWGVIKENGSFLIKPQFEEITLFFEGLACIKIDNKYGFIDKTGKLVIPAKFEKWSFFEEGLASVKENEEGFGYINKQGKFLIKPQFVDTRSFSEGLAYVRYKDRRFGYINKNGNFLFKPPSDNSGYFSEGYAVVKVYDYKKAPYSLTGFIDKNNKIVIEPQFMLTGEYKEGMAKFTFKGDKWGFINKKGDVVINESFDQVSDFSEGLASFKSGTKEGYLDKKGNVVIDPKYDMALDFKNGLALVRDNNVKSYIDLKGNIIWTQMAAKTKTKINSDEQRDGFKTIKIGDPKSKYQDFLTFKSSTNSCNTYDYMPNQMDLYYLFDLKLDKIYLSFDANQELVEIKLVKYYFGRSSYGNSIAALDNIEPKLKTLFGNHTGSKETAKIWEMKNITVLSDAVPRDLDNTELEVTLTSNSFRKKSILSGF